MPVIRWSQLPKAIGNRDLSLVLFKLPIRPRLSLRTFVGNVWIGFVFDPEARSRTIQPQAAMNVALIPDWLRFAHFAAPGTPLASARHSLRTDWPLTTGHSDLTRHSPLATGHSVFTSVIRHLIFAIRHLTIAIRLFAFPIPRSEFRIPHFLTHVHRSHQLALPGGLVAPVPLEFRAAIQRRAIVPLGGLLGLDCLMLGQQLLEPAGVPLDDRADEGQRLGLIAGRRGDLAIGH